MFSRTLVRQVLFLIVLSAGVCCVGNLFAGEIKAEVKITTDATPEARAQERPKAVADLPRELSMRPLPAYRIEPPDILQIEITNVKAAGSGGSQSSLQSSLQSAIQSASQSSSQPTSQTSSQSASQTSSQSASQTSSQPASQTSSQPEQGTLVIGSAAVSGSGSPANIVVAGSGSPTTVTAGTLTVSGDNTLSGTTTTDAGGLSKTGGSMLILKIANQVEEPLKTGSGTLTLSGGNTYTGTTTVSGGSGSNVIHFDTSTGTVMGTGGGVPFVAAAPADVLKIQRMDSKSSAARLVNGQYLVGPDGTINLRQYGTVQVMGMTIEETKAAVEKHLSKYFESLEVSVVVLGYNSKVFYVISDGAGYGDNVRRIPMTGKETVLDAVAAVGGLSQLSSKKMWIARPSATDPENGTVLPVDYEGITRRGATSTNYQIMPGDRLFIAEDSDVALNNKLSKATAPVERMLGLISLGTATIESIERVLFQQPRK